MCAAFGEWARQQGWVPYAETAGFDVLLVHGDGTQIGVQAKQKFNMEVLRQILDGTNPYWGSGTGPDFRAVLTPESPPMHITLALGLMAFHVERYGRVTQAPIVEFNPNIEGGWPSASGWHYWSPTKRCELPAYIPDVAAGSPAPTQLTKWKVAALRIAATLELRGFVTRDDFWLQGIDHRRWTQDWLAKGAEPGQWIRGQRMPDFAAQHPVVYPQVVAELALASQPPRAKDALDDGERE
jgi:hypothetical protein